MGTEIYTAHYVIQKNYLTGFIASLAISLIQVVWAAIALFAIKVTVNNFHTEFKHFILLGSAILIVMAIQLYLRERKWEKMDKPLKNKKLTMVFLEAGLFALSAPTRLLGYTVVFAVLGVDKRDPTFVERAPLLVGVFLGAIFWWSVYLFGINKKRDKLSTKSLAKLQKIAAIVLFCLALIGLINALFFTP